MKIFKYPLPGLSVAMEISMPDGARILCVQTQNGVPCIWALVDPSNPMIRRGLSVVGTGSDVEHMPQD